MRAVIRNLYARVLGVHGQASIGATVALIERHVERLNAARGRLYSEIHANDDVIEARKQRNRELFADADRAVRLELKLREFIT